MSRVDPGARHSVSVEPRWPERVGSYRVLEQIGCGSTGLVLRCVDERNEHVSAVKLALTSGSGVNAALRREFALLFRLRTADRHGVVTALESGQSEGRAWYSMSFVSGMDLAALMARLWQPQQPGAAFGTSLVGDEAPVAPPESGESMLLPQPFAQRATNGSEAGAGRLLPLLAFASRLARTLASLHSQGVVHSDVSPRNVLVTAEGLPTLVDFSAAFHASAVETAREVAQPELGVRGTPGYMAPEQISGGAVDGRADLYAFGCILYELVTGKAPFMASDASGLLAQHVRASPLPPSARVGGVPAALDALILSLLQKEPQQRLPYALDAAAALDALAGLQASLELQQPEPPPLYRARVVGQERHVSALESQLANARAGRGGVVLLEGEAGTGKTRLLNELVVRAHLAGAGVVTSSCGEAGPSSALARPAFGPLRPLLERIAELAKSSAGVDLRRKLGPELGVLAPFEASLLELREGQPEPAIFPPEMARARLLRAMTRVLRALSEERPLLLVLDDLHCADELTSQVVARALDGALDGTRVLLAGSYRAGALDAGLLRAVEAHPERRLELSPLTLDDARSLAKDMLATEHLPEGLPEFLFRRSGGNVLLTVEYLKILAGRGDLTSQGSRRWTFSQPAAEAVALPASLHELLELKLSGLSADARRVLDRACVYRADFSLELIEDEAEQPGLALPSGALLQELVARQVLEERGPDRYRFVHETLRDAAERLLAPALRRARHRRAAERLAVHAAAGAPAVTDAELAAHHAQAGDHAQAQLLFERAGRHAAHAHAYHVAAELLREAVSQGELAFEPGASDARSTLAPLREELADVLVRTARHEEARKHYDAVADQRHDVLQAARALRKKGKSYWLVHDYPSALATLDVAASRLGEVEQLGTVEQLREWIELSQGRFWVYYFGRRIGAPSAELVRRMEPVVERAGTAAQKAMFYQCAAGELMARERYAYSPTAVEHARRAVHFSDAERYPAEAADARFALGFALLPGDRAACAEAVTHLSEGARSLAEIGDATVLSRLLTYQAVAERRLGNVEAVRATATHALDAAETARLPAYVGAATACLAWVAWLEGDVATARRQAAAADSLWTSDRHVFPFRRLASFMLLEARYAAEDFEAALPILTLLLEAQQQRLPQSLADALEAARRDCAANDARRASDALAAVLRLARELGLD